MHTFDIWAIRKKDVRKLTEFFYLMKCFLGKVGVTMLQCNQIVSLLHMSAYLFSDIFSMLVPEMLHMSA
jgi:hypothetical protein